MTYHSIWARIRGLLFSVTVEGESGWPELVPGRRYLASSIPIIRVGDTVVFRTVTDSSRFYVKKVQEIHPDGYVVSGTVSWATDSRDFGVVPFDSVLGKIIR